MISQLKHIVSQADYYKLSIFCPLLKQRAKTINTNQSIIHDRGGAGVNNF